MWGNWARDGTLSDSEDRSLVEGDISRVLNLRSGCSDLCSPPVIRSEELVGDLFGIGTKAERGARLLCPN